MVGMNKIRTVFVRLSGANDVFEWRPPSGDTPVGELLQLLKQHRYVKDGDHVDLIEDVTGLPVDPESKVESLRDGTLSARGMFVGDALQQLKALQTQAPDLIDFEPIPGSALVRIALRCPGLVRRSTLARDEVFIRATHQVLAILPGSFPDRPPRLIWRTPIFHPNLRTDEEVWPPRFTWKEAPSLAMLITTLVETLLGLRIETKGLLNLRKGSSVDHQASSWFRRHKRLIDAFGRSVGYPLSQTYEGFPLVSPGVKWGLEGSIAGGAPTVFLSQRFSQGFRQLSDHGPGWLLGQRGDGDGAPWFYVDRLVLSYTGSAPPHCAIGTFNGTWASWKPAWSGQHPPLLAEVRDDRAVFRLDREFGEVTGYFVRRDDPDNVEGSEQQTQVVGRPQIRVTSEAPTRASDMEPWTMDAESSTDLAGRDGNTAGTLTQRNLDPPVCVYCGTVCASEQEVGVCANCHTLAHTECCTRLGGWPVHRMSKEPFVDLLGSLNSESMEWDGS